MDLYGRGLLGGQLEAVRFATSKGMNLTGEKNDSFVVLSGRSSIEEYRAVGLLAVVVADELSPVHSEPLRFHDFSPSPRAYHRLFEMA